jgi:hypothetical protein
MSEDNYYDELYEQYLSDNSFSKYVELMDERIRRLNTTKCVKCKSIGLEAISINSSMCNKCKTVHNV